MKNSILVFMFSLLMCSSTFLAGCVSENSWEKLSVDEFETQISETSPLFILDVRTQIEWEQDGHLDGAYLIPHSEIEQRASELPENKDEPIFLHCKSGARSTNAAQTLQRSRIYRHKGDGAWYKSLEGSRKTCSIRRMNLKRIVEFQSWRTSDER